MVTIRLHGSLGQAVKSEYCLDVKSTSEAIHAINVLSKGKLYKFLDKNKEAQFRVLINQLPVENSEKLNNLNSEELINDIKQSELCLRTDRLQEIDIVPVLELADKGILGIVLGAVLIIVGVLLIGTPAGFLSAPLIIGGLGLIAAGVMNLLAKPPKFDDFREINGGSKASYLFNGPTNTIGEGGPVPIGYGRLIVGSQTVATAYDVYNIPIAEVATPDSSGPGGTTGGGTITGRTRILAINAGSTDTIDDWAPGLVIGSRGFVYLAGGTSPLEVLDQTLLTTSATTNQSAMSYTIPAALYKTAIARTEQFGRLSKVRINHNLGFQYGGKSVIIRLYFSEIDSSVTGVGQRIMKIRQNNFTDLAASFDIYSVTGANNKATSLVYTTNFTPQGVIDITLEQTNSDLKPPLLCAYEIFV